MKVELPESIERRVREIYARAGYTSPSALIADATVRHLETLMSYPVDAEKEDLLQRARAIVPQSDEREHWDTGEPFTANACLETRFVALVIETHGQTGANRANRWTQLDFQTPPEDRDITMEQWTRLQFRAGMITPDDVERWDLPMHWIEE